MSTTETTPVVASAPQAEVQPEPTATNENQLLERKELFASSRQQLVRPGPTKMS